MTTDEKLNYLAGEVAAMAAFIRALAATHPDRQQLLIEFESRIQVALAATLSTTVSESYVDGFHARAKSLQIK